MKNWKNLKKELLKDKKVAREYEKLTPRYQLVSELIKVRLKKGLTQEELAQKIGTKQSAIARLESGRENISIDSLGKMAGALDARIRILLN